jgi:hypothetical protein
VPFAVYLSPGFIVYSMQIIVLEKIDFVEEEVVGEEKIDIFYR